MEFYYLFVVNKQVNMRYEKVWCRHACM